MKSKLVTVLLTLATILGGMALAQPTPAPTAQAVGSTGTVVFFRAKRFVGAVEGIKVREGEVELGRLKNGTYFTIKAAPGKHQYAAHSLYKDLLTLEVDAGETYYLQAILTVGGPELSPSDQATFEALKAELKDLTGTDKKP